MPLHMSWTYSLYRSQVQPLSICILPGMSDWGFKYTPPINTAFEEYIGEQNWFNPS